MAARLAVGVAATEERVVRAPGAVSSAVIAVLRAIGRE